MKTYRVEITGKTPLLMHSDNIAWADHMDEWKNSPANKKGSKAGDDRSPAWRWIGSLYHDGQVLCMPNANIMRCLMEGGAMVPVPGGKMGKTFKSQTQSGMCSVEPSWPLVTSTGQVVRWADISALKEENEFGKHLGAVRELGFDLNVKRAKIGTSKHIRVRPEFAAGWKVTGHLSVWDEQINDDTLANIAEYAGQYKGLGDWRPGGKTPGPYGTFEAVVKRVS
jgi:hypothetical protein